MGFPLLFVLTHFSGIDLKTFSLSGFSNSVLSVDVISLVRFSSFCGLNLGDLVQQAVFCPFPALSCLLLLRVSFHIQVAQPRTLTYCLQPAR